MHPAHARAVVRVAEQLRTIAPAYLSRQLLAIGDELEAVAYSKLEPNHG